jgi:membrane protease YdiL (CAAX protease family)
MVFDFAFTVAATAPPDDAARVIQLAFLVAAGVFAAFMGVRQATGKTRAAAVTATPATLPPPLPPEACWPCDAPASPAPAADSAADRPGWLRVRMNFYGWLDLPLIGLVFLVYFALTALPGDSGSVPLEKQFTPQALIASMLFQLMLMGMVIGFMSWRCKPAEWLGLRWKSWPLAFAIAPLTVFSMWFLMGALHLSGWNGWLERSLGIDSMQEAVKLLQESHDALVVGLMAVAAVLVAPVTEEVVFRGYLYPAAKRFCGPIGGVLFSSLVFAAAHGNVVALAPLFVLAVLLCVIFEFTGSLWACIAVHFLFNGATVAMQLLARSGAVELPATP